MRKVIIVHGYTGYPDKNWFPWLKSELENEGVEVIVPQMPETNAPELDKWLSYLQAVVLEPNEDTYFVGHSLGCITILKYIEKVHEGKIGGAVLVAGFAEPIHLTELNNFFVTELDDKKIKDHVKNIILITSDNDEHVPLWQGEKMRDRFNAHLIVIKSAGHINEKSGFKELPLVVTELGKLMKL